MLTLPQKGIVFMPSFLLEKSRVAELPPGDEFEGAAPKEHQNPLLRPLGAPSSKGTFEHLLSAPREHQNPLLRPLGAPSSKGTFDHLLEVPAGKLKHTEAKLGRQFCFLNFLISTAFTLHKPTVL